MNQDRSRDRSRRDRPTRFSEPSRDRSNDRGRGSLKSSNNRVFVSNIPYEFRWQDLKDVFRTQVGDVQFVELFTDEKDKAKGCGVVEFTDAESVQKCLEVMQRFEVKGRKLVIKEDRGNKRDKHGAIVGQKRGGRDSGFREERFDSDSFRQDIKWGNTYGLCPEFLESLNIDGPLSTRVFVANLAYNIDKKKLKEVFRLAGKIQSVDVPVDKDGRSRGFAVVEYDHPVEAVQAISMLHNQVLYDRHITVRLDRANETFRLPEGLKGIGMGLGSNGEPLKNVSLNLPSLSSATTTPSSILSSVPTSALQVANALSSLTSNNNPLSNLTNPSAVLQAANLSSLLNNQLGSSDLSLGNSVSNPPQSLSGGGNVVQNMSSNSNQSFTRSDNSYQSSNYSQNSSFGQHRLNFQSNFETQKQNNFSGYGSSSNNYGEIQMNKSMGGGSSGGRLNRKVLVSNLPPLLSYKLLHEKFSEFGDIELFEEKGQGNLIIEFASEWQAEAAVKNLDRARIDGRLIGACLY